MTLPKVKTKKLIKKAEFDKAAAKVRASLEAEIEYLRQKKLEHGDNLPLHTYLFS